MKLSLTTTVMNASQEKISSDTHEVAQLVNDDQYDMFMLLNHSIINASVCLCGLVTNILNIVIFLKQGFDNTMNISFFSLAISDLCCLITLFGLILCFSPWFIKLDMIIYPLEIPYLTAGIPHICFNRITGWITVFVTAERCLCIMLPLKIKQIITPKVTTITVCVIYVGIMLSIFPEYQTAYIDWKFFPSTNKTLLGLVFTSDRKSMEGLVFILNSFLGLACFIAVIIFTVILVLKLKQKSKFHQQANIDKSRSESITTRDRRTMNMVVMIATVLIISYTPGIVISISSSLIPEFSVLGSQANVFYSVWSIACTFQALNSSVNIIIYYKMSTRYRETFKEVFHMTRGHQGTDVTTVTSTHSRTRRSTS